MVKRILLVIFLVTLNKVSSQMIDHITSSPVSLNSALHAKWEHLLPTLKILKSNSNINREKLLEVVKLIKYLLSDDDDKIECDRILEEINETKDLEVPDIEITIKDRLNTINEFYDNENVEFGNAILEVNDPQNKTADFSKILAKISTALAKLKEQNEKEETVEPPELMGMFRTGNNALNTPLFDTLGQTPKTHSKRSEIDSMADETRFTIPCHRASDILTETFNYVVPKAAYCDVSRHANLNNVINDPRLNLDSLLFNVVPNSVSCVDTEDSVAVLFRPKRLSMMQVYGNLLRKISSTVLVPYHVSKLSL